MTTASFGAQNLTLKIFGALFVLGVSVFSGLLAVVLPYWFVIAMALVPLFLVAAWAFPGYALVFVLLISGGFLPDAFLPHLPIAGGTLRPQEIFLVIVAGVLVIKRTQDHRLQERIRPYFRPIFALMALAFISAVVSKFYLHLQTSDITDELRPFMFWVYALLVPMAINDKADFTRFLKALVIAAIMLALAQTLQALLATHLPFPLIHGGRIEEAMVGSTAYEDVIRSTVPGIYLIIFALLFVFAGYLHGRRSFWFTMAAAGLFITALLFTYGRSLWGATIFGLLLLGWQVGFARFWKVFLLGTIAISLLVLAIFLAKPDTFVALQDRALSVSSEGAHKTSLGWRFEENEFAWQAIRRSPVVGIGLGANYKPVLLIDTLQDWKSERRFMHNGHLYVLLKLGLVGAGVLFWLLAHYFFHARSLLRHLSDDNDRALVVASITLLPLLLITANIRAEWMSFPTVAVLATVMGLLAALERLQPGPLPANSTGARKHL